MSENSWVVGMATCNNQESWVTKYMDSNFNLRISRQMHVYVLSLVTMSHVIKKKTPFVQECILYISHATFSVTYKKQTYLLKNPIYLI